MHAQEDVPSPRLWYLNGGFDLALGAIDPGKFADQLKEMTLWYLLGGGAQDWVIGDVDVPESFRAYCVGLGLDLPALVSATESLSGHHGWAWGWDEPAASRLTGHGAIVHHPPFNAVRRVNSRSWSHEVAAANGYGVPGSRLCRSRAELDRAVADLGSRQAVIKPNHGNAGIGFLFVNVPGDAQRFRQRMNALFTEPGHAVIVEPWLKRIADLSSHFLLRRSGSIDALRHYQTLTTAGGAFYGIVCREDNTMVNPWEPVLTETARAVAHALHREGYFGPVSIDSMIAELPGQNAALVPLLEVNARDSMSFIAFALRQRLAPGRPCLMRTVGRRQNRLPGSYGEWFSAAGKDAYDPASRRGIVCATPLRLSGSAGEPEQPSRSIFFLAGESVADVERLDRKLSSMVRGPTTATAPTG